MQSLGDRIRNMSKSTPVVSDPNLAAYQQTQQNRQLMQEMNASAIGKESLMAGQTQNSPAEQKKMKAINWKAIAVGVAILIVVVLVIMFLKKKNEQDSSNMSEEDSEAVNARNSSRIEDRFHNIQSRNFGTNPRHRNRSTNGPTNGPVSGPAQHHTFNRNILSSTRQEALRPGNSAESETYHVSNSHAPTQTPSQTQQPSSIRDSQRPTQVQSFRAAQEEVVAMRKSDEAASERPRVEELPDDVSTMTDEQKRQHMIREAKRLKQQERELQDSEDDDTASENDDTENDNADNDASDEKEG